MIAYPVLENELFCDIFYLRNLCNTSKFPDWPISNPLKLLKEVLMAWRLEVEKKPSSMTAADALAVLGNSIITVRKLAFYENQTSLERYWI